jgi:hypothetical protein
MILKQTFEKAMRIVLQKPKIPRMDQTLKGPWKKGLKLS